jgi:hypothetical protein
MGGMFVPLIGKIADVAGLGKALMVVAILPLVGFVISLMLPKEEAARDVVARPVASED